MEDRKPKVTMFEPTLSISHRNKPSDVKRPRVAAYCRVSTESEEQQGSFRTQTEYYESFIKRNPDWDFAGIYADEGISGAKAENRPDFLRMVDDALAGKIDIIYMKSITRMGRNTLDNVYYIRLLREKGVYIRFEEEKMDTASEQCEFMLTLMSSLGQQEIMNTSAHVKKTFRMRMERGELVGGSVPLGYGFDKETRSLFIIEEEAKIVRYIYKRYCDGAGGSMIARECMERGWVTKKGGRVWHDTTVIGIITNERYKGDLLQGKTFTVDPISKRRLVNYGESVSSYVEGHHPPIVSKEVWEKANEIRKTRAMNRKRDEKGRITNYSREHPMSSMLQCGFCGHALTRRSWNGGTKYKKVVWQCASAVKGGKKNCPHSKGIPEEVIQEAFVLAYNAVFKDKSTMIAATLAKVEAVLSGSSVKGTAQRQRKLLDAKKEQINKLTNAFLDGTVDEDFYRKKSAEIKKEIEELESAIRSYDERLFEQEAVAERVRSARAFLESQPGRGVERFSPELFNLVIEQVIVGSKENGEIDPYRLVFIFKDSSSTSINVKKPSAKGKEGKSADALCSSWHDAGESLCSSTGDDARRDCCNVESERAEKVGLPSNF
ncbi:MAG: recombinase family protein [Bacilli bacterium]|nr:recombinase family protein [Bacilli bacterium]